MNFPQGETKVLIPIILLVNPAWLNLLILLCKSPSLPQPSNSQTNREGKPRCRWICISTKNFELFYPLSSNRFFHHFFLCTCPRNLLISRNMRFYAITLTQKIGGNVALLSPKFIIISIYILLYPWKKMKRKKWESRKTFTMYLK